MCVLHMHFPQLAQDFETSSFGMMAASSSSAAVLSGTESENEIIGNSQVFSRASRMGSDVHNRQSGQRLHSESRSRSMTGSDSASSGMRSQFFCDAQILPKDRIGPPIIVAVIGTPDGRWSEFADGNSHYVGFRDAWICAALKAFSCFGQLQASGRSWLLGFAVVQAWEFKQHSDVDIGMLMRKCLSHKHRRSKSLHFLEHAVIDATSLVKPVPIVSDAYSMTASEFAVILAGRVGSAFCQSTTSSLGCLLSVRLVISEWSKHHDIPAKVHVWPANLLPAAALCSGTLRADVSALVPRDCVDLWHPPCLPPRALRRRLQTVPGCVGMHAVFAGESGRIPGHGHCRTAPIAICDRINALVAGQDLKDQSKTERTLRATLRFFYPHDWAERLQRFKVSGRRVPGKSLLKMDRLRYDVAAMLWHREWSQNRPLFRYVSMDASPQLQMSHEVFVCAERIVTRSEISGKSMSEVSTSSIQTRMLPLATLGQGTSTLQDKIAAHIHQTWLEYGPSQSSVRTACASVRQVLTDMGCEFGCANYHDAINHVVKAFGHIDHAASQTDLSHLFPYALQVPGLLHILDWIIRQAVESLTFWPAWQARAKRVLQYCHGANHRNLLRQLIRQKIACKEHAKKRDRMCKTLVTSTGRFAKWRWKTLDTAVKDLLRVSEALSWLSHNLVSFSKELHMRDTGNAKILQTTCKDRSFWEQASAIQYVINPVMAFMKWIQGCDCHEAELLEGKSISCPFKGCRAKNVSSQVKSVLELLRHHRVQLQHPESRRHFASVNCSDVASALQKAEVSFQFKLHWVDELPYLIWQAVIFFSENKHL